MLTAKIKKAIRRTPVLGDALLAVRYRLQSRYEFARVALPPAGTEREVAQALNLLTFTKTSGQSYSAVTHPAGYHTIKVSGTTLAGQRNPQQRLDKAAFDFAGKTVLDIGSNQGGMLHAMEGKLKWGVGLDFNPKLVNAATRVAGIRGDSTLKFYTFDLETDPLDLIEDLLPEPKVDVVFLLSVCMWIKNWRQVIAKAASIADHMLFESNGTEEQQNEQEAELRKVFASVTLLAGESADDAGGQRRRRLFWCAARAKTD